MERIEVSPTTTSWANGPDDNQRKDRRMRQVRFLIVLIGTLVASMAAPASAAPITETTHVDDITADLQGHVLADVCATLS